MNIFIVYLIAVNFLAFAMYYSDKKKSLRNEYRIAEKYLILIVLMGGTLGAFIAMFKIRHKIKKVSFMVPVVIASIVNLTLLFYVVFEKQLIK